MDIKTLTDEFNKLAAMVGEKGFIVKVLEQEIQLAHQRMFKIQRDIEVLAEPAPPEAS